MTIAVPLNDYECLGTISQILQTMVDLRDPTLVELARQYPTTRELVEYLRALPQRDDLLNPEDGPRVRACVPTARLRIGAPNPNCVERAALFIAVEELNDPGHTRALATVDTKVGAHTFPLVDGKPIILDPRISAECLECGLAMAAEGPIAVEPRNAVAWTVDMASQGSDAVRNGPSSLYVGKNAIRRMLDEGAVPAEREIDAMGLLFALAERVARRYGTRALEIVRTAARAVADALDALLSSRNAHLDIGGVRFDTPRWLDDTASALGNVGLDVGSAVLRTKLDALDLAGLLGLPGGTQGLVGLVESRFQEQGRTLGNVAHPPQLATFAQFAAPRTGA